MWNSIITTNNEIQNDHIKKIIDGKNSSIIVKKFFQEEDCKKIIKKISHLKIENDSKKPEGDLIAKVSHSGAAGY